MDPAAPPINYQDVLSEFIHRQTLILGPHITFAKLSHIKGIHADTKGYIKKIEGDPQQLLEEVVAEFKPLSEFLVKNTLEKILSQPQALLHFDQNMPATKTEESASDPTTVTHPTLNPLNPLSHRIEPTKVHSFLGLFTKSKHENQDMPVIDKSNVEGK